jgi:hypothetical protein
METASPPSPRRFVLATSTSGLSNRMLNLAGSLRIARALGRDFVLHWPRTSNLDCPFEALFTNRFETLGPEHVAHLLDTEVRVTVYESDPGGVVNRAHYRSIDPKDDSHVLVVKGWNGPTFRREKGERAGALAQPCLRELVPTAEIRAEVAQVPDLEQAIGVHVRRGDTAHAFAGSRDEDYVTILAKVLARRPDARFYLATDDEASERTFTQAFPRAVFTAPKSAYGWPARRSVEGMRTAVADLYRLARTRAVLGNHKSTYSWVAALLGPDRLVIANAKNAFGRAWEALLE